MSKSPIILSVPLLLLTFSLLLLSACTPSKSTTELVTLAKSSLAEKQWSEAIIYLNNALSQQDENSADTKGESEGEVRLLLGQSYLGLGDMPQAERFLAQAVAGDVNLTLSIGLYSRALFHQHKFQPLLSVIERYRKKRPELAIELSLYEVLVLHKTGQQQRAGDLLAIVTELSQNKTSSLGIFTQAYTQADTSPQRALELIAQLLTLAPNYVDGYLLKAQILFSEKNFDGAYTAFAHYLTLQPHAYHIHFLLAVTALQLSKLEVTQDHVTKLLTLNKNHPLANHLQALLAFEEKEYPRAKFHAENSIQHDLDLPANYLIAGVSAFKLQQESQAYDHLTKAAKAMPDNQQIKKILTLLQVKLGYLQEAVDNFEGLTLSDEMGLSLGNMLAAELLSTTNNAPSNTKAQHILAKMQFVPLTNPILKLQQGILQLKSGDKQGLLAIEKVAEQALEQNDGSNIAAIAYIMALVDEGELNKAILQAQQWQQKIPNNLAAMNILALLHQKNNDKEKATRWYERALAVDKKNIPSLLFQAYQLANKDQAEQAIAYFKQVLTIKPNHARAFSGILHLRTNTTPDWSMLQALIDLTYEHQHILQQLGQAMIQARAYEELYRYLHDDTVQHNWGNKVWHIWLQVLLTLQKEEQLKDAISRFSQKHSSTDNLLFVISLLEKAQRFDDILNFIDQQTQVGHERRKLQYAKASALLSLGQIEKADFIISRLEYAEPLPALNWLLAQLALLKKDHTLAQQHFTLHFAEQPTLSGLIQLSNFLLAKGSYKEVIRLGKYYLSVQPNDSHARTLLSQWLAKIDTSAAIAFLDVPENLNFIKQNWLVANNLAWLYLNSEQKKQALIFSKYAFDQQPLHNEVAFTHAVALMHHGQKKSALSILLNIKQPNEDILKLVNSLQE
ncbi:MAG: PEP-CTERM system TPR-repeat protein PrsT [Colwellia sp.]|nr:PEP-CTERM system TPR-repeat protein PrsT [Colwellia sp.]